MTFSIIIPAHNAAKRIWKLLDSIRRQTFTDYEVIVVCDACEDHTAIVARSYGCDVLEINAHNDGVARNTGIECATGDWALFADDDDWWINDYALEQIINEISEMQTKPDIIQCSFVFGHDGVTQTMNNRIWPNVWSKVWRREAIGDTRFPNVYAESDLHFVRDMVKKDCTIMCMPILWYYYNYMRPGSITWALQSGKRVES